MAETNIIQPAELEVFVNSLRCHQIAEIGSKQWLQSHETLVKLNQQAIIEAKEFREEAVKEYLIMNEKLEVLVHEAISVFVWRTKVLPKILTIDEHPKATFLIYGVLYHEAVSISLLEIVLYHESGCLALGECAIELIDYCAQAITQLIGLVNIKHFREERPATDLMKESTKEEIERQSKDISYKIGIRCLTILSYIADKLPSLPLSITRRLVQTHDMPCLLSEVLHCQPWLRNVNGIEKFIDDTWTPTFGDDIKKVTKIEAQTWFCLRQLLFNSDVMRMYEINEYRQRQISKCQALLGMQIIDQLPPLADLKHHLCTLSLSGGGKQHLDSILMEEVPMIRNKLVATAQKIGFKNIAKKQVNDIFNLNNENIAQTAKCLSSAYNSEFFVENNVDEGGQKKSDGAGEKRNYCGHCGAAAEKKCSKCQKTFYCGRECQIENWPIHKRICVS